MMMLTNRCMMFSIWGNLIDSLILHKDNFNSTKNSGVHSQVPSTQLEALVILSLLQSLKNAWLIERVNRLLKRILRSRRNFSKDCILRALKKRKVDRICLWRALRMSWVNALLCLIKREFLHEQKLQKESRCSSQVMSLIWSKPKLKFPELSTTQIVSKELKLIEAIQNHSQEIYSISKILIIKPIFWIQWMLHKWN